MKSSALLKQGYLHLCDDVKLRKEYFGGLVFNTKTGTTLEVDDEAFQLLWNIKQSNGVHTDSLLKQKQMHDVIALFLSMEVIVLSESDLVMSLRSKDMIMKHNRLQVPDENLQTFALSAPETVHMAVTYRCEENCLDCYARGYPADKELDTIEICGIITDIAKQGVFQLAIGGGEPFLRSDLYEIVRHATEQGLVVHITTGQYAFNAQLAEVLKYAKSLHVGIRSESLIADVDSTMESLKLLAKQTLKSDTLIGANLIITRFTINNLHRLVELLVSCGVQRLIFLRYKPIKNIARWQSQNPGKEELRIFEEELLHIKSNYPQIMIRLDCASAFLMKDMDDAVAFKAGIKGCVAGDRIMSVSPDGSVYPCSQLVGVDFNAGNLMCNSLGEIWHDSNVLNNYRNFRQGLSFKSSACGNCTASRFCGGCRIFAEDTLGGETHCPIL